MVETTRNITVLMGEYIIIKKRDNKKIIIESPGIENCVIIVLESSEGVAVAHLDTHLVAATTINKITNGLKAMQNETEENSTTATLFGGIVGFSLCRYKIIYEAIYKALKEHNIPYKHLEYSYCTPLGSGLAITSALCVGLQYFGFISMPTPYPLNLPALSSMALFLTLSYVIEATLDKHILNSYDVRIMLEANKNTVIDTTINDKKNNNRILNNATQEQLQYFFNTRMKLNPNPTVLASDSIDSLQLRDISNISNNPRPFKYK